MWLFNTESLMVGTHQQWHTKSMAMYRSSTHSNSLIQGNEKKIVSRKEMEFLTVFRVFPSEIF